MTHRTGRRAALGAGAALLAAPWAAPARAQEGRFRGRELVATAFGGPSQDLIQRAVYEPLSRETGGRFSQLPLLSAQAFARMRAEAAAPQVDLFMFSGGQERPAKADGLTQPLPGTAAFAAVPENLRDPEGHWVAWGVVTQGILYREDKVPAPPRSYADFFRPEYQGHVAFPHVTNGYGTDFLVMLARMNGGGETNITPGIEAMRRIAPRASIFRAAAEVQTLFASGDVWIMPYDGASAMRSKAMGIPVGFSVPEEGSPFVLLVGCCARRSRNADLASAVLERHLDPEVQARVAREIGWAPTSREAALPADVAAYMAPTDRLAAFDRDAINAARPAWTERFNREIAR